MRDLNEIHEPSLDGKPRMRDVDRGPVDLTKPGSPGAESYDVFFRRATRCLEGIVADNPSATVVVATHAGVVRAAMSVFGKSPLGEGMFLEVDHTSITEFIYGSPFAGRFVWRLRRFNDAAHIAQ
jgi:broad specificity phosphatase PhoE